MIKMYRVKPTRVILSAEMAAAYANLRMSKDRFPGIFFSVRKVISRGLNLLGFSMVRV
jgi:hypothetical protein